MSNQLTAATAIDTSVIVPGLLFWHEKHAVASAALIELLESGNQVVLPLHSLVEAYAVMTRLPPPHRLSAKDALDLLNGSFRQRSNLVGLEGDEGWELLQSLRDRDLVGGTSYDSLIFASARKGGARRLLTFNRSHFERIAGEEIEIVVPATAPRG